MTETKRFQWNERIEGGIVDEFIVDNLTKKGLDEEDMCELLNDLSEENEKLKMHMNSAKAYLEGGHTKKAIERLKIIDIR